MTQTRNYTGFSTTLNPDDSHEFKAYCESIERSSSWVMRKLVQEHLTKIKQHAKD